jgi:hypothetical protein
LSGSTGSQKFRKVFFVVFGWHGRVVALRLFFRRFTISHHLGGGMHGCPSRGLTGTGASKLFTKRVQQLVKKHCPEGS